MDVCLPDKETINQTPATKVATYDESEKESNNFSNSEKISSDIANVKKEKVGGGGGCSPSPPLVLIQTVSGDEQKLSLNQLLDDLSATTTNVDPPKKSSPTNSLDLTNKQLAIIEATNLNEMELVMRLINEKFPSVKINFFLNNKNGEEQSVDRIASTSSTTTLTEKENSSIKLAGINKNSLSASYMNDRGRVSSNRTTSIDSSALSANNIERQESRDSGFWSVSKCSFESMKSLSISDSHSGDSNNNSRYFDFLFL